MYILMKMNYYYQREKKFKNIYNKKLDRLEELILKIDYDDLKCVARNSGNETDFTEVEDLNNIRTNKITTEKAKNSQEEFNKYLEK